LHSPGYRIILNKILDKADKGNTKHLQRPTPEDDIEHYKKELKVPCNGEILHLQDNRIRQVPYLETLLPMHQPRPENQLQNLPSLQEYM
jgi:hypothetical protein